MTSSCQSDGPAMGRACPENAMNTVQPYSVCDTPDGVMICGPHAQTAGENLAGGTVSSVYCLIRGRKACLVDTGRFERSYNLLADILRTQRLGLEYIILTHDHYDHVGNAERLRAEFGGRIVAHALDAPLLADPLLPYEPVGMRAAYRASWEEAFADLGLTSEDLEKARSTVAEYFAVPVKPDLLLEKDGGLDFEGLELRLLHTPGHSPGSLSVYVPRTRSLYSGDLTFWVNPCRPYPIGNAAHCRESLRRVQNLRPAWLGPGHDGGISAPLPWLDALLARHEKLEEDILRTLVCPHGLKELRAMIFPVDPRDSFAPIPENSIQSVLIDLLRRGKVQRRTCGASGIWQCR